MAFAWMLHDESGAVVRTTEPFDTRAEAEEWMGERWADLVAEGATAVSLTSGDEVLYRMGLAAE
ncbi:MAG TPA: hypothetical protein VHJ34_11705 [Actinomycetota bacterium]|nr:hypothetical protein [Actinomycetota bacterium]